MEILRCLIAGIPQKVLADIVQSVTQQDEKIDVVGQVSNIADVPEILDKQKVDVLILGMQGDTSHQLCEQMLKQFPDLLIVGLINDGRATVIFMGDVGSSQLVRILKLHRLAREQ